MISVKEFRSYSECNAALPVANGKYHGIIYETRNIKCTTAQGSFGWVEVAIGVTVS